MINEWCGYSAPGLGHCQCADPKNHEWGGKFHREGRLPDQVTSRDHLRALLADAWTAGYDACEDSHHGRGNIPNPWEVAEPVTPSTLCIEDVIRSVQTDFTRWREGDFT